MDKKWKNIKKHVFSPKFLAVAPTVQCAVQYNPAYVGQKKKKFISPYMCVYEYMHNAHNQCRYVEYIVYINIWGLFIF